MIAEIILVATVVLFGILLPLISVFIDYNWSNKTTFIEFILIALIVSGHILDCMIKDIYTYGKWMNTRNMLS